MSDAAGSPPRMSVKDRIAKLNAGTALPSAPSTPITPSTTTRRLQVPTPKKEGDAGPSTNSQAGPASGGMQSLSFGPPYSQLEGSRSTHGRIEKVDEGKKTASSQEEHDEPPHDGPTGVASSPSEVEDIPRSVVANRIAQLQGVVALPSPIRSSVGAQVLSMSVPSRNRSSSGGGSTQPPATGDGAGSEVKDGAQAVTSASSTERAPATDVTEVVTSAPRQKTDSQPSEPVSAEETRPAAHSSEGATVAVETPVKQRATAIAAALRGDTLFSPFGRGPGPRLARMPSDSDASRRPQPALVTPAAGTLEHATMSRPAMPKRKAKTLPKSEERSTGQEL